MLGRVLVPAVQAVLAREASAAARLTPHSEQVDLSALLHRRRLSVKSKLTPVEEQDWSRLYSAAWNSDKFFLLQKLIAFQALALGPGATGALLYSGEVHQAIAAFFSAMPLCLWLIVSRLQRDFPLSVSLSPDNQHVCVAQTTPFGTASRTVFATNDAEPSPRHSNNEFVYLTFVQNGQSTRFSIQKEGITNHLMFERVADGLMHTSSSPTGAPSE